MSEVQPDFLGGKDRSASSMPRVRKGSVIRIAPAGHAAPPGTGPVGEACGGCTYMETLHYRKTYHKCRARAGDHWKGGRATDVRPMDAACSKFERLANRLPAQAPTSQAPADPISTLGVGSHRVTADGRAYDILIAPAVSRPKSEESDERQISLFE